MSNSTEPCRDEAVKLEAVAIANAVSTPQHDDHCSCGECLQWEAAYQAAILALFRTRTLPPLQDDDVERVVSAFAEQHGVFEDDEHDDKLIVCTPDEARVTLLAALSTRPATHTACFEQAARIAREHYATPGWPEMYQEAGRGIAKAILDTAPTGTVGGEEKRDPAYDYAVSLLRTLHGKHCPKQAGLQMLPDTLGVLTQIDNLTTALTKPAALPKEGEEAYQVTALMGGTRAKLVVSYGSIDPYTTADRAKAESVLAQVAALSPAYRDARIETVALSSLPISGEVELRAAAQGILDRKTSTYKARNGREVGIQGDDGEKCWIVHSDDIHALEAALNPQPQEGE